METIKRDPYASLRVPEFKYFLVIRFAVIFALSMQFAVIEWKVYELTNDPLSLGFIGLAEIIPSFSLALFAGNIVDKREKRGILLKCLAAYFVISTSLFLLTWDRAVAGIDKQHVVLLVYLMVFCGGIVRAFVAPATFTMLSLVVPREALTNGITWSTSAWQVGGIMGPALGGLCIFWMGVHWTMLLVVGILLLPFLSLLQIKPKPVHYKETGESVAQRLSAGLKFVWKTKVVLNAMTLDMFAVLFGGSVAILTIYAKDILHVGPQGYGLMRAAPAVGACLTMLILAYRPLVNKPGIKLLAAVFGFGIAMIVFGVSTWFPLSLLALFMSGMLDGISVNIRQTILQMKTPDDMRGRVSSVSSMFIGSSNELGAFESGLAAKLLGTVRSVVFGGCVTLGVVITTYIISPAMRNLDLHPDKKD
ncbi:MFS transporter [Chitinophaga horti]|uniref:Multidrug efflux pump Tap n=1 Tax=Chitinophaga horti TaxID=2920382 RepID=A0ABY6J3K9_9BACT|nr:MFS transporter [Chitinophaga horti]UYQ93961.1 MFS transporter [Chitinophaga horti]